MVTAAVCSSSQPCALGLSPGEKELLRGLGLERYGALARFLFSIGLSKGDMARVAAKRKSSLRVSGLPPLPPAIPCDL